MNADRRGPVADAADVRTIGQTLACRQRLFGFIPGGDARFFVRSARLRGSFDLHVQRVRIVSTCVCERPASRSRCKDAFAADPREFPGPGQEVQSLMLLRLRRARTSQKSALALAAALRSILSGGRDRRRQHQRQTPKTCTHLANSLARESDERLDHGRVREWTAILI